MRPISETRRIVLAAARLVLALGLCAMAFSCSFMGFRAEKQQNAPERSIATLVHFTGTVVVKVHGRWGVMPVPDMPLYSGDKVITMDGTALIGFPDGARVSVCTNSNLEVTQDLEEWVPFRTRRFTDRGLILLCGRLFFQTGREKIQTHFITPATIFSVFYGRGNVSVDNDLKTWIVMDKGQSVFKIGDFKTGFAPLMTERRADQSPLLQAALAAEIAANQANLAAEEQAAGNMTAAQKAWYTAQREEKSAEELYAASDVLDIYHPDQFVLARARRDKRTAKKIMAEADRAKKRAISEGAVAPGTEMPDTGKDTVRVNAPASYTHEGAAPALPPPSGSPVFTPGDSSSTP